MSDVAGPITQGVKFEITTPATLTGLERTLDLLNQLRAATHAVNAAASGGAKVSAAEMQEAVKSLKLVSKGSASEIVDALAKAAPEAKKAGANWAQHFNAEFAAKLKAGLAQLPKEYFRSNGSFVNAAKAGQGLAGQINQQANGSLADLLQQAGKVSARVAVASGSTSAAATGDVAGNVKLTIPAARIEAYLKEDGQKIRLEIPASRVEGAATGGAGGKSGGGGKAGGEADAALLGADGLFGGSGTGSGTGADEIRRRIKRTKKAVTTSVTRAIDDLTRTIETTVETPKGSSVTSQVTDIDPAKAFRESVLARARAAAQARANGYSPTGDKPADLRGKSALSTGMANDLRAIIKAEQGTADSLGQSAVLSKMALTAANLDKAAREDLVRADQVAAAARDRAAKAALAAAKRIAEEKAAALRAEESTRKAALASQQAYQKSREAAGKRSAADQEKADAEARRALGVQSRFAGTLTTVEAARERMKQLAADGYAETGVRRRTGASTKGGAGGLDITTFSKDIGGQRYTETFRIASQGGTTLAASMETAQRALKATSAEAGALGSNLAANIGKVSSWAVSVGVLYGALGLAKAGLTAFIETSYQLQRLDVVYSKLGGSTRALGQDVMELAAVNGRSTKEALEAAVAWSRLGLTRRQVNEAVRVSLEAANVAELDAAEATQYFQAVMAAYQLQVSGLAGVLGEVNAVSNAWNVTNKDLLTGLSRTASVAQQAGVSLSELIGLIGAGVGTTGQTGANIGNAIKSVLVSLSNPETQKFLKNGIGLDVHGADGELKSLSTVLAELYTRYQALGKAEQGTILFNVAGKTQASRLQALLDSYVRSQVLAINAQLNLNSAQDENKRIVDTARASLQGLATELTRFAANQGANGPGQALGYLAKTLTNLLRVANTGGVSQVLTGLTGLLAAVGVKAAWSAAKLDAASKTPGFTGRSYKAVGDGIKDTVGYLGNLAQAFEASTAKSNAFMQGLGARIGQLDRWGKAARDAGVAMMSAGGTQLAFGATGGRVGGRSTAGPGLTNLLTGVGAAATGAAATGLALVGAALAEIAIPLAIVVGGFWAFNKAMEAIGQSSDSSNERLDTFAKKAQQAASAAEAAALAVRLFDTAAKTLADAPGRERSNIVKLLGELQGGLGIDKATQSQLLGTRDPATLKGLLGPAAENARRMALAQQQVGFQQKERALAEKDNEIKRLKGAFFPSEKGIQAAETERAAMAGDYLKSYLDLQEGSNEALDKSVDGEQRKLLLLERQQAAMQVIASMAVHGDDPVTKAGAERRSAEAQLEYLELRGRLLDADIERLRTQERAENAAADAASRRANLLREQFGKAHPEMLAAVDKAGGPGKFSPGFKILPENFTAEMQRQLETIGDLEQTARGIKPSLALKDALSEKNQVLAPAIDEARRKADAQAQAQRALEAQVADARARGASFARADIERYKVGDNETEKLVNQIRGHKELNALFERRNALAADAFAKQEAIGALEDNRKMQAQAVNELYARGQKLQAEEKQLMIDKRREFEKAALMAGPGELLKRLAALQATGNGTKSISAGRFLALGDMRQYVTDQPGYGFDDGRLRKERREFESLGLTPDVVRGSAQQAQSDIQSLDERARRIQGEMMARFAGEFGQTTSAFSSALDRVTSGALQRFEDMLGKLADGLGVSGGVNRGVDFTLPAQNFSEVPALGA